MILPSELFKGGAALAAGFLAAVFVVLFVLERLFPLRRAKRALRGRIWINAVTTTAALLTAAALVKPVATRLAHANVSGRGGLLGWFALPASAHFAAGFLLMDLTFYYWHRATHVVGLLWRFHNVHHFDPDLDVTTSFRFHFAEIVISTAFRAAQIAVLGITPLVLVGYETAFFAATMFHHSNLQLPIGLERFLNKLIVTPRMHGIHHSAVAGETNSNYSSVFRWWDTIHRTLVLNVKQAEITIGVPGYMRAGDNRLGNIFGSPFARQKEYWRWPSGKEGQRRRPGVTGGPQRLQR